MMSKNKRNKVVPLTPVHNKKHEDTSSTDSDDQVVARLENRPILSNQSFNSASATSSFLITSTPFDRGRSFDFTTSIPNYMPRSTSHHSQINGHMSTIHTPIPAPLPPLRTHCIRKGGILPTYDVTWNADKSGILGSLLTHSVLKVHVGTWNMNGQKELPSSLDDFLLPLSQETAADLYAIGTQESTPNKPDWELLLQQTLGPNFVLIHSASLGVIYFHIFLRRDLIWYCSAVQSITYSTRPVNMIKTKGGVAIHITIFGSSFIFITSHFTSSDHKVSERNSDMQRTLSYISFSGDEIEKPCIADSNHHLFWCGDLNYRVGLDRVRAEQLINESNWTSLLLHDQLTQEILSENVFERFSEQPITFPPSYKFDVGTDVYDSSEKNRTPSWTDRVLFRCAKEGGILGCCYQSCQDINLSDHKPVYSRFRVKLKPCDEVDGVPLNPVGYNRELYSEAMKRRKQVANISMVLRNGTKNENSRTKQEFATKSVSSTVCTII